MSYGRPIRSDGRDGAHGGISTPTSNPSPFAPNQSRKNRGRRLLRATAAAEQGGAERSGARAGGTVRRLLAAAPSGERGVREGAAPAEELRQRARTGGGGASNERAAAAHAGRKAAAARRGPTAGSPGVAAPTLGSPIDDVLRRSAAPATRAYGRQRLRCARRGAGSRAAFGASATAARAAGSRGAAVPRAGKSGGQGAGSGARKEQGGAIETASAGPVAEQRRRGNPEAQLVSGSDTIVVSPRVLHWGLDQREREMRGRDYRRR